MYTHSNVSSTIIRENTHTPRQKTMIRTIAFALLLSTALIILMTCAQGAAAQQQQQTKGVALDWPVLAPLRPGTLTNITLAGYENYSKVVVFIYRSGHFEERFQYSVSGTIGHLTIEMPPFERGTLVSLKADGIKQQYENHPVDDYPVAYSQFEYLYAERSLTDQRPEKARSVRSPGAPRSAYILGRPVAVRHGQTVTILWEGFASDTYVCARFVCPKSINHAPPKPAYAEYSYFTLAHLNPEMQLGCYVTAAECNPTTFEVLSEPVRSAENYMLLLQ